MTAYRPGPRRGNLNANEDPIASEAADGIAQLESMLADHAALVLV